MTTMTMPSSQGPRNPVIVEGEGPVPSPFMVIGEAPGRSEIEDGRPFVGRSGQLLRSTLVEFLPLHAFDFGTKSEDVFYITNAYKGDVGDGNRTPTKEELDDHFPLLLEEVKAVNPSGILLVGATATHLFLPDISMREANGVRFEVEQENGHDQLYPVYHPAAVLRNPNFLEDFRYAIARFVLTTEVLHKYER